ncbi:hypothetical protein Goshw_009910 [Gossypium schwendimanii]|uniref:DUF7745 domain-containing protein n=1 Tax=Gossypium schwendimanii TaxID=34291 RepID=A0A7J9NBV8_GOSSC|nr:hypothetical protein [Gossypium schwendimanii]
MKVDKHLFRAFAQFWNPAYSCFTFGKKLMHITGISEHWVATRIKQKGDIVFPKALGHVDEVVTDLFDRLDKRVTPVQMILAETFRLLNACRKASEGRFIRCAQLLLAWFYNHFWKDIE